MTTSAGSDLIARSDGIISHGADSIFVRGSRCRAARYRVKDWRAHGLYQPRHGQHWVYINGNYVLIAAASGIITTILLDRAGGH